MLKKSKKAAVALFTAGFIATTAFSYVNIKAGEIYDDSTIGISSALDRYVESAQVKETDNNLSDSTKKETKKQTTKKSSTKEKKTETCKYPQFKDKCITTVSDSVNIRSSADETSDIVGTLPVNGVATVVYKGRDWTEIKSGSCEGYIKNDFLVFGDDAGKYAEANCGKVAVVTTESLRVRETANEDANCLTMVAGGESYSVVDQVTGWIGIALDEETFGYVSADYVNIEFALNEAVSVEEAAAAEELRKQEEEAEAERLRQEAEAAEAASEEQTEATTETVYEEPDAEEVTTEESTEAYTEEPTETPTEEPTTEEPSYVPSSGSTGVDLANFALQFVGNPYVYGGSSLTNGADCSGFVMAVYAEFGYSLPHSAGMQSGYGSEVSLSEIEPGDLLFYSYGGSIGHVAIYVGGGTIVHASTEETGIKTSNYDYNAPCKAVRIIGQ